MPKTSPELFAAIHVGSEQIGMQIVEYTDLRSIKIVERAQRQVVLGEETFKTGRIGFNSISEVCELLKGYRRMMSEYDVGEYRLIATTAIREAKNQQYIIDQIKVKTGFKVEVVDMPQEIFFKYVAMFKALQERQITKEADGILFVDISSGGLGFTLYQERKIKYHQNIHIGALRIKESFDKTQRDSAYFQQALAEYIYSTIELVEQELGQYKIKYLVLSGFETRLLQKMLGGEQSAQLSFVSLADFYHLYEQVRMLNLPQLMKKFDLSESKAEMVLPTILLYSQILSLASSDEIVIAGDSVMDGITYLHVAQQYEDKWLDMLEEQVVSFARALGRKYQYDSQHAGRVEEASLLLFDRLVKVHGLGRRERLQLKVATILHDIGKFVSLRKHYFYSYRLIASSDMPGFSEREKEVIANVAYYHSKGTPNDSDSNFSLLSMEQKVTVAKLAALIRLADALDRSHRQKAVIHDIVLKGDEMIISVSAQEDMSLEEWTFVDKADFFEDVFGIRAILERQAGSR
ncbi:ppx/gppa phosphatase [Lucifera butyrica]|uniref:Ppx/gppa phosphatase n=1 Tax=Lucifera butyrica TaxID=1351585 RepID=A0A498R7F8_9FIRM|nr:HD domain-containing protein [Lucifera butyrica]VBB06915.1 ppx/gppa phosphatase [Lucifera butyrica]